MPPPVAGFELLPHTADIGIRATGVSQEEVFEQLDEHEVGGRRRTLCVHRKGRPGRSVPATPSCPTPPATGPAGR